MTHVGLTISGNEIFSLKQKDLSDKLNRDELNQINTLIESLKVNPAVAHSMYCLDNIHLHQQENIHK